MSTVPAPEKTAISYLRLDDATDGHRLRRRR